MPLEIAEHAGFCMGVRRAVEAAVAIAEKGETACTLGELIHNPQVVSMLRDKGIPPVATPEEAQGRKVLIRSHGVSLDVIERIEKLGCTAVDLTCPFVDRLHRIVHENTADGTPVIIVGEREHPEVQGTAGWAGGEVYFVASVQEAEALPPVERAVAVAQTTFPPESWEESSLCTYFSVSSPAEEPRSSYMWARLLICMDTTAKAPV